MFDHIAETMNHFTEALGLSRYTLYRQDYGGPLGFRMALTHPDRIDGLIVQDAVAHNESLGAIWKTRRAFWADRAPPTKTRFVPTPCRCRRRGRAMSEAIPPWNAMTPICWTDEFALLNQPGQVEIQSDLFYDYRTNVDNDPRWQACIHEKQPRLLVIWGKYDLSFDLGEPERYRKDVPKTQVHVLDAGHFALDAESCRRGALDEAFQTDPSCYDACRNLKDRRPKELFHSTIELKRP
jgi:pimeloyl-ACP methyl ester carboxylesterase